MKEQTALLKYSAFIVFILFFTSLSAQDFVKSKTNDFEWRLIGRVFFDGGAFFNDKTDLGNGFQVNDVRLGTQIRFLENWSAKIELGYGDGKVSMKDVFVGYRFGEHDLQLGHFFEPFGNDRIGSTNFKFMTIASADKTLGNKRKLGISYSYNRTCFNFMGGVFSDGDIDKANALDQGYNLAAKLIGRPWQGDKKMLHLAVAPRFSSRGDQVNFTSGVPTNLLSKENNNFIEARLDQAINQWKMEVEAIFLYNKWYAEGHYLLAHVNRAGLPNYNAEGWYVQGGYMIIGEKQNYDARSGMIKNPAPKSLEVLCRYNRTNLNDGEIVGGKMSDVTVGANYFINKYIVAKINYVRVMVDDSALAGADDFNLMQARLQFSF